LRDRDTGTEEIDDLQPIIRMKLSCRNSENLLLTDDVLTVLGTTWDQLKEGVETWLGTNMEHPHYSVMREFKDGRYNRKDSDIKAIRNDLMGIIGSEKPWEVIVGQVIANLTWNNNTNFEEEGKMVSYLGKKVIENIGPRANS